MKLKESKNRRIENNKNGCNFEEDEVFEKRDDDRNPNLFSAIRCWEIEW